MRAYELRRGHAKVLAGDGLRAILETVYGAVDEADGRYVVSGDALERMTAWTDGKALYVETTTRPGATDEEAARTVARFNRFLERATGYTAKERGKRLQKQAKASPDGGQGA